MAELIILAGIPGCGKSTWAENHVKTSEGTWTIVSTDTIREELGDVNNQAKNGEVFDTFHERIRNALLSEVNCIADSTALEGSARMKLREIAKGAGAKTHLIFFTNIEQAQVRNKKRERVVHDKAMARMIDRWREAAADLVRGHRYDYDSFSVELDGSPINPPLSQSFLEDQIEDSLQRSHK